MYFHGPYEVADIASKRLYAESDSYQQIYLSGLTIFTTDRARHLTVKQRKCRMYYESNLRHFPVYSYTLCRMECRAKLALKLCGCLPHFYRKMGKKYYYFLGYNCSENIFTHEAKCHKIIRQTSLYNSIKSPNIFITIYRNIKILPMKFRHFFLGDEKICNIKGLKCLHPFKGILNTFSD